MPDLPLSIELTAPNGVKYTQPTGLFINNEFVKGSSDETITSINPTNEQEIASVHAASADDIDKAVKAASAAFKDPSWSDLSATERGKLMYKLAELIDQHANILATIDCWDNGKIFKNAMGDVLAGKATFEYFAGWADKNFGQVLDVGPNKLAYTLKQPVGVCGQIIPWNYPFLMAVWKLGPALACGNTVVMKPAEQTPLSILYFMNLVKEAGYPPGVVNIVNGLGSVAGKALATHLGVDKIAFTGSTATGKEIMKMAAVNMKNLTLETGGKSPLLVFDDADLEQTVKWAHKGIMSNAGQVCCATSRIIVQDSIYDTFVAQFREYVHKISVVGDPFEDSTVQGPQITKIQHEKVLGFATSGKEEGAKLIAGGEAFSHQASGGKGFFVQPTIFADVKPSMKIYREEVFGPFVVIASFKTEDEAIEMANGTTYGLGSAVFTQNLARAHRVARRIEAGMVWVNSSNDSDYRVPFGGVKQSGIGREFGEAGLHAYTQTKSVHVNIGTTI